LSFKTGIGVLQLYIFSPEIGDFSVLQNQWVRVASNNENAEPTDSWTAAIIC
jgi:hypothetical protein